MIRNRAIAACAVGVLVSAATAQGYRPSIPKKINWTRNAEQAIQTAKKTKLPLMFFVEGDSRERDNRLNDARRLAFLDERVIYAARRFICVKVARSDSRLRSLFAKLQVRAEANSVAVFSTPGGERIDRFSAVHQPDTFAQKMTLVFNVYRTRLFDQEIKPVLSEHKTKAATLKKAFAIIAKFNIEPADAAVIEVLDRWKTDRVMSKQGFAALASISTKQAVDYLFTKAKTGMHGQNAAAALAKCTPAAAALMLPSLTGDDADRMLLAYNAVCKICRIKKSKPDRFWDGKNERLKNQEIERVKKIVERTAARWEKSLGKYR